MFVSDSDGHRMPVTILVSSVETWIPSILLTETELQADRV